MRSVIAAAARRLPGRTTLSSARQRRACRRVAQTIGSAIVIEGGTKASLLLDSW